MPKQETPNAQLIHHYTHVVCALNETRKGSPTGVEQHDITSNATAAIEHTIKGVCQLIDSLVAAEHPTTMRTN
jgi:phosphatidylethanolamine-binding protein (PEBP) family uncharacterized protein